MPDVYERPQCPPGCRGETLGTCRVDRASRDKGHESLFPARSLLELRVIRLMRMQFWSVVKFFRTTAEDIAFSMDASWRMIRPEFGTA